MIWYWYGVGGSPYYLVLDGNDGQVARVYRQSDAREIVAAHNLIQHAEEFLETLPESHRPKLAALRKHYTERI